MQERGLSAYLAELIGTFLLVFFITSVVVLFVATGTRHSSARISRLSVSSTHSCCSA